MMFFWYVVRVIIVAVIVVTVATISRRFPRWGALLLSLPLVSILAFLLSWFQFKDLPAISRLSRDTLIFIPLSLPFFLPFAFAQRLGIGFWTAFAAGLALTVCVIGTFLIFAPSK
ncbi:MAG: hypothetical protein K8R36_03890 [Planctomycetales bacterium]|nr:hypothetical protein [Planctomycetales bacterium]